MNLSPMKSLPFVAKFLDDGDAVTAESAAIAIGSSHLPAFARVQEMLEIDEFVAGSSNPVVSSKCSRYSC
jgi:hypothetical protein